MIPHINFDDLSQIKIPALKGRARKNNLLILETIAIEGPLLKYDVHKKLNKRGVPEYSTIARRIDALKKRGYLDKANQRVTERGKRKAETMYGLTWKGFIASFASKKVRENTLCVIGRNPLLRIPEKEFVLLVLGEVFNSKEIEDNATLLLWGCLKAIANFEIIKEDQIMLYILQGTREIPPNLIKMNEIPEKKKDLTKLLDNPRILQLVIERVLPVVAEWQRNLYTMLQLLEAVNQIGDFVRKLRPEDKPSERLKEYLEHLNSEEEIPQGVES